MSHQQHMNEQQLNQLIKYKRIVAFIIDGWLFFVLLSVFCMIWASHSLIPDEYFQSIVGSFGLLFYLLKDVIGLGKYCMKLYIGYADTKARVAWHRRLLRNTTFILMPLEIIFLFVSGERLGDRLAKTQVYLKKK